MVSPRNDELTNPAVTNRLTRRIALRRLGQGGLMASAGTVLGAGHVLADDSAGTPAATTAIDTGEVIIPETTRDAISSADGEPGGRLRRLTDYDRALWLEMDQQWLSVEGEIFNVRAFGAVGDGSTDDWPAFNMAIESMTSALDPNSTSAYGRTLYVPPGTFRLAQTLVIDRSIRLVGASSIGPNTDSILQVDPGIIGILISAGDPALTGQPGRLGEGTIIERLRIVSAPPSDGAKTQPKSAKAASVETDPNAVHGIWIQARASVRDTCIEQFSGDGIRIDIAAEVDAIPQANWEVSNCWIAASGSNGLAVTGNGSGIARLTNATKNGSWGFLDGGTGGSTFLHCHAGENMSGPFSSVGQSRSLFIECIADPKQQLSTFGANTLVVAGVYPDGYQGGNAWTADSSRMLLQAQSPSAGGKTLPTVPTLLVRGVDGQVRAHLRISNQNGGRVAEVDSAGRLLIGPADLIPTAPGAQPIQVQISHAESGRAGLRWTVADGSGATGWVAQARAYHGGVPSDANPQGGGSRLTFQTPAQDGRELDTLTLSQGSIGIGTIAPAALLDLSSTSQGFLPPRLTSDQRDAIQSPPVGLMIYNTTTKRLNFHDGDNWNEVAVS